MGNPRSDLFILPKIGINRHLQMKSNAGTLLKIPFRTSEHVSVVNKESFLGGIVRCSPEDSLTVVLMIRPNVNKTLSDW
jgi:hypothetical protein